MRETQVALVYCCASKNQKLGSKYFWIASLAIPADCHICTYSFARAIIQETIIHS